LLIKKFLHQSLGNLGFKLEDFLYKEIRAARQTPHQTFSLWEKNFMAVPTETHKSWPASRSPKGRRLVLGRGLEASFEFRF
jgi:hypothetical protein